MFKWLSDMRQRKSDAVDAERVELKKILRLAIAADDAGLVKITVKRLRKLRKL